MLRPALSSSVPTNFEIPPVDDRDSDEELVTEMGYENLSLILQCGSLPPKRRYQILRWRAGADRKIRRRLRITRVRWAYIFWTLLWRQHIAQVKLVRVLSQQQRLSVVHAFEQLFMRVLNKHFCRLPLRMQKLIAEFVA